MNISNLISKLNALRPWQLVALAMMTQIPLLLMFLILPSWRENAGVATFKIWLLCGFACLGLIVDMVVFYYARPGDFRSPWADSWPPELRALFVHAMYRRALVIGVTMLAGGLAL